MLNIIIICKSELVTVHPTATKQRHSKTPEGQEQR